MMQRLAVLLFCFIPFGFVAGISSPVQAKNDLQAIPPLTGPVIDLTATLTDTQKQQLSQKLLSLHQKYGGQMQVLMIPTSAPEDAFSYSLRVVEQWKLGSAEKDDGLLLFIAKNDRRSHIHVGYGLEGTIPDAIANRLQSEAMVPYFQQGDYYGGINAVIDEVYARISGDASLAPVNPQRRSGGQFGDQIIIFAFIAFIVLKVMKSLMGGVATTFVGGPLIFLVAWFFIGIPVLMALMGSFILLMFALSPAAGAGRGYYGGGGFGGGGFGGGGWSGGGGGFGGGGAGGRW